MAIPIPHRQLFIDGEWKEPAKGKRIPIINPANETVIGDIPAATVEDVELAVEAARRAFYRNGGREWARASGATRAKYLRSIASKIRERASELAKLEALDSGKPLDETTWDLDDVASCFEYYADLAESLDGKQRTPVSVPLQTFKSYVIKEPIGVVGLITPWNYPLLMATWKVAPALAAGCTAVLKPSELASVTCLELAEVCKEVELPPGVLNIITGLGSEAGAPLASHPLVDKILYRISSPMSSVNSSVRQDTRQHSQVYCHCHLKCVVYTCYRGPNRGRQFYRCIHNRTDDDCNFFKWIDELEDPSFDTHYALRGIDDKVLKKLDLLIFQMKVFIVFVAIDIIIRMYFA